MGGHIDITKDFVEGPYPQGYIYNSNINMTMGVFSTRTHSS